MTTHTLQGSVDGLKALAHPVRLRILSLLRGGELCVCQITEVLGLAPSTISEHLSLLRRAGIIRERKEGKWVFYGLAEVQAFGPLCATLWPLVEGDPALKVDARHCAKVRKLALSSLCKKAGETLPLQRSPLIAAILQSASVATPPVLKNAE